MNKSFFFQNLKNLRTWRSMYTEPRNYSAVKNCLFYIHSLYNCVSFIFILSSCTFKNLVLVNNILVIKFWKDKVIFTYSLQKSEPNLLFTQKSCFFSWIFRFLYCEIFYISFSIIISLIIVKYILNPIYFHRFIQLYKSS